MIKDAPSVYMIEVVAHALQEIREDVVFVGGATVPFYIENDAGEIPRPTEDVDLIIEIANRTAYYSLEEKLRKKGFINSTNKEDPICRWKINQVVVDIMPT